MFWSLSRRLNIVIQARGDGAFSFLLLCYVLFFFSCSLFPFLASCRYYTFIIILLKYPLSSRAFNVILSYLPSASPQLFISMFHIRSFLIFQFHILKNGGQRKRGKEHTFSWTDCFTCLILFFAKRRTFKVYAISLQKPDAGLGGACT